MSKLLACTCLLILSILTETHIWAQTVLPLNAPKGALSSEAIYKDLVIKSTQSHAQPRYAELEKHANALHAGLLLACRTKADAVQPEIVALYEKVVLAWARVHHLHWGPASKDYKHGRMLFGADPAEFVWKKLAFLLYTQEKSVLDRQVLVTHTTAIQGLTALEHLLFTPLPLDSLRPYHCELATVIAENIAIMSSELRQEWANSSNYVQNLRNPDPTHPFVQNYNEAAMQFFKPLAGGMSFMINLDLRYVLHDGPQNARDDHVTYWRAGLSRKVLVEKLNAFEDLYRYGGFAEALAPIDFALHTEIIHKFQQVREKIFEIEIPLRAAMKDQYYHQHLKDTAHTLDQLWHLLTYQMAEYFAFAIGFNQFDGD